MNNQIKGSLLIMISAVCFSSYGLWSKLMASSFDCFYQGWTRAIIVIFVLFIVGIMTYFYPSTVISDYLPLEVFTKPLRILII